jgi:hypothetical protein
VDDIQDAVRPDVDEPTASHGNAPGAEGEAEPASPGIVGHLQNAAEPIANAVEPFMEHVVGPVAGAIGSVIEAAGQAWAVPEAAIGRWLRSLETQPLANLYEIFPEARQASPRELGMRFVPVEDIRGTAVAGAAQRGGDFLPLKPFRGENWAGRWRRILDANERLQPLPPVDLIKYNDEYWVVDGHNRVAAALYAKGVGLDAMVVELVPLNGRTSERPRNILASMGEAGELRAAMRQAGQLADEAAALDTPEADTDAPVGDR